MSGDEKLGPATTDNMKRVREVFRAFVDDSRRKATATQQPLNTAWLSRIVRSVFEEGVKAEQERKLNAEFDSLDFRRPENRPYFMKYGNTDAEIEQALARDDIIPENVVAYEQAKENEALYEEAVRRADWEVGADYALQVVKEENLALSDRDFRALCVDLLHAAWEVNRHIVAHSEGRWDIKPISPVVLAALAEPRVPQPQPQAPDLGEQRPSKAHPHPKARATPLELIEKFIQERFRDAKSLRRPKYPDEYRQSVRMLEEIVGSKPVNAYTRENLVDFKDALLLVPKAYKQRFKVTVLEAIQANEAKKFPTLDSHTIGRRLTQVRDFFDWAEKNAFLDENPAQGVHLARSKKKKRRQRDPFSIGELERLFHSPLFVGCKSDFYWKEPGDHKIRDHRYWLPLLALWTGARMAELAQLLVEDVKTDKEIAYLDVCDDPGDDDAHASDQKRLKTEPSRRIVPIHKELIALGFLEYVAEVKRIHRSDARARLFPLCERGADGEYSPFSKFFRRMLEAAGIKTKRLVFHSFRHSFEDAMREAKLDESVRYRITGRTRDHSEAMYGRGESAITLKSHIDTVKYDDLDLSHLYPGSHPANKEKS
jgi:integrase